MRLNECAEAAVATAPDSNSTITDADRYSRQVLFGGIGAAGQERLRAAQVAIVGCGAMGAASASLLARAGVGTLTLIDRDFVEPSNLQRQVLFDEADARESLPKAEAARRHIAEFNSGVTVHARIADLVPGNVAELLQDADILLDATDNFETRYLVNDYAVEQGKPWIYAAAIGAYAATMNTLPLASPTLQPALATACLACIFPKPPSGNVETCDTAGILSTAVNLAASIQVTEALKFLTGQAHLMRRTLLSFDLWTPAGGRAPPGPLGRSLGRHHRGRAARVCGEPHLYASGRQEPCGAHHAVRPGLGADPRASPPGGLRCDARASGGASHADIDELRSNDLILRFRRGTHTLTLFADGRAIVQGTTDITVARSLYARFVGA